MRALLIHHNMDMLWKKFRWILPLYMKPISFQSNASVVCSVTWVIVIHFCLKKLNVFSQQIGKKAKWISDFRRRNPQELMCWSSFSVNYFLKYCLVLQHQPIMKQGKSEGFESCDWPIVRKRPIWVKIGDVLYRVTLKFDGWPWKTIGHISLAVSSFVQHFIAIGEFKLELQSGNAQFGSNSTIFRAVWPSNLMYDLEKQ